MDSTKIDGRQKALPLVSQVYLSDVKTALEQLGYQYDPDRGWTKVIHEEVDSNALATEVLRHMGGKLPQHWREGGMIRSFLRSIAEKAGAPAA